MDDLQKIFFICFALLIEQCQESTHTEQASFRVCIGMSPDLVPDILLIQYALCIFQPTAHSIAPHTKILIQKYTVWMVIAGSDIAEDLVFAEQ